MTMMTTTKDVDDNDDDDEIDDDDVDEVDGMIGWIQVNLMSKRSILALSVTLLKVPPDLSLILYEHGRMSLNVRQNPLYFTMSLGQPLPEMTDL